MKHSLCTLSHQTMPSERSGTSLSLSRQAGTAMFLLRKSDKLGSRPSRTSSCVTQRWHACTHMLLTPFFPCGRLSILDTIRIMFCLHVQTAKRVMVLRPF